MYTCMSYIPIAIVHSEKNCPIYISNNAEHSQSSYGLEFNFEDSFNTVNIKHFYETMYGISPF